MTSATSMTFAARPPRRSADPQERVGRHAGFSSRADRLLVALLGYGVSSYGDDHDPRQQRDRDRERIRAVQNVMARRRLRKLRGLRPGAVARRLP